MKVKQFKGITLIALVITIIVLLILAGVTIYMLTGDNGILKQATNARETNDKSEFEEQIKLAVMASRVNDTSSINVEILDEELNKISGIATTKSAENRLPWTVKKESYELTINVDGTITRNTVIEQATAAKPKGSTIDPTTNKDTGIVMIDTNGSEWVWVEVPITVFKTATSSTDYENIKADLIAYASDYRDKNYADGWYSGCGLTQGEYTTKYQAMLSSIYTNKGFYIGRYEAGIDGSDTNISLARKSRTEITSSSPKAVSRKDMIPYNYVRCSDAQQLANGMATGNKTSSLMFGIQWDLVCKFLEVKGNWDTTTNTAQYYINENSTSWGNYGNSIFTIDSTNAKKYSAWKSISGQKTQSALLTTGATEYTNKMNIYDFAGNEYEWTLEKSPVPDRFPCTRRGGSYALTSVPAFYRNYIRTTYADYDNGFRASLY